MSSPLLFVGRASNVVLPLELLDKTEGIIAVAVVVVVVATAAVVVAAVVDDTVLFKNAPMCVVLFFCGASWYLTSKAFIEALLEPSLLLLVVVVVAVKAVVRNWEAVEVVVLACEGEEVGEEGVGLEVGEVEVEEAVPEMTRFGTDAMSDGLLVKIGGDGNIVDLEDTVDNSFSASIVARLLERGCDFRLLVAFVIIPWWPLFTTPPAPVPD